MRSFVIFCLTFVMSVPAFAQGTFSGQTKKQDVETVCNAVLRWQIDNHSRSRHHDLDWTNGALYRGVVEWGKMTARGDCFDFVRNIGAKYMWSMYRRTYHADDICVGQAFIELSRLYNSPDRRRPTMERAFWVASHPSSAPFMKNDPVGKNERWSWCDALFMAPPVYAALYTITGEQVYADYLESEFRICVDSLYDKDDHLFYRDNMRIPKREPNGAKQFWGRGNGWVFGGIPLVLDNLPADYPHRDYYITIFRQMAKRLVGIQDEQGAWHASLLDPGSWPDPENSCSAFFCYGLAWGLNNGVLKGAEYENALKKGWASVVRGVHPDGKLGYVQPVGADPRASGYDTTDVYGVGAFLLAGSELLKLEGVKPITDKSQIR